MNKYIYDENNGLWYELQGDYDILCLTLPAEKENKPIGIWGRRHARYLKQHHKVLYMNLLTSGKRNSRLADIDRQAQECFETLIEQMKQAQGITPYPSFSMLFEPLKQGGLTLKSVSYASCLSQALDKSQKIIIIWII